MISTISLLAVQGAVRVRYATAVGTGYGTCGNSLGRCVNLWKCQQRHGQYGRQCDSDIRRQHG